MADPLKKKVADTIESDFIAYHYDTDEMIATLEEIEEYIDFSLDGLYKEKKEWEEWEESRK